MGLRIDSWGVAGEWRRARTCGTWQGPGAVRGFPGHGRASLCVRIRGAWQGSGTARGFAGRRAPYPPFTRVGLVGQWAGPRSGPSQGGQLRWRFRACGEVDMARRVGFARASEHINAHVGSDELLALFAEGDALVTMTAFDGLELVAVSAGKSCHCIFFSDVAGGSHRTY